MRAAAATAAARRTKAAARPAARSTRPAPRRPAGRRAQTRPVSPRIPRRVSGPARGRARPAMARRPDQRPEVVAAARVVATARFVRALPDRPVVGRLVRGQGWIAVLGFLLIGIVAMQVSLLKLNAGIGRDVERAGNLERRNGELRAEVSRLSSGERIQARAAALGMVMPRPGAVAYVVAKPRSRGSAAARAVRDGRFAPGAPTVLLPGAPVTTQPVAGTVP